MPNLLPTIEKIIAARHELPAARASLIAISGIDASGKGYLTALLAEALQRRGYRVANINIDGWLNLPHVRFSENHPAEHFYRHAIRFDEMFRELIFPLRDRRSLSLEVDYTEETAAAYRKRSFVYDGIDIILLEGIFLLKRAFQSYYDLSFWVDCRFETALERALARGQEGLQPDATLRAYRTIYFPAQEIHLTCDEPKTAASQTIPNDTRLST
jgi:uridine kinase